jgi:uridine kinase
MTIRHADSFPHVPIVLVGGTASEIGKTTFAKRLVSHLSGREATAAGDEPNEQVER